MALYALLALFYVACRDLLQPFNPVPNFIIIKYVVFLTYWQCDVVDISDDEDSFLLENDAGVIPKDENLNYDLPPPKTFSMPREEDGASSSGTNLRSSFIGMGFAPALVDKAIKEKDEENSELILEALFSYDVSVNPRKIKVINYHIFILLDFGLT
ncbi:probable inactive DNA (cytosine-5)-methyltransferase DRM3 [Salvia miltiorrhiza]|uniref:probable inactive DNA (cytosine-5)-methyltransferase DRM3 n=1 Tax=Salvia miltiorrhiza TaxID=226208 RepID=UPI0025AC3462|nr:probable inactive DNA (cytosine-5)-methyltransferase DRM3 [Salvia miltiorrhiza]